MINYFEYEHEYDEDFSEEDEEPQDCNVFVEREDIIYRFENQIQMAEMFGDLPRWDSLEEIYVVYQEDDEDDEDESELNDDTKVLPESCSTISEL